MTPVAPVQIVVLDDWHDDRPGEGARVTVSGQGTKVADARGETTWRLGFPEDTVSIRVEYRSLFGPEHTEWGGMGFLLKQGHRYIFRAGAGSLDVDDGYEIGSGLEVSPLAQAKLQDTDGWDIFLSHASEDDELAARVAKLLSASGIKVFTTGPGFPTGIWSDEVRAALEESEHFWLLLTDKALDRSVYVHHEFGYFFGWHREKNALSDARVIGRRLRYFVEDGNRRRPGMYQHFQDFPIDGFDDPVVIGRVIASEIGRVLEEPENPDEYRIGGSGGAATPPDGLATLQIVRTSSSAPPDYSYGIFTIAVLSPVAIFTVGAVAWHDQVYVSPLKPLPQVGAGRKEQLSLRADWAKDTEPPQELQDTQKRRYVMQRPRGPGPPWAPLYITFETESGEAWAAVAYMRVETHQKGFPEVQLLHGPNPFGWVKGHLGTP